MTEQPPSDPEAALFAVFNEIGIVAQLSRTLFEARLPDGVLVSHWAVLNSLERVRDGRTLIELAHAFEVPKTTMSHSVAALERRGWVTLRPNPRDGRSKTVWLTEAGRTFRAEAVARLSGDLAQIGAALPEGAAEGMLPGLARLRAVLDARRADG